jgi:hypothetical protein
MVFYVYCRKQSKIDKNTHNEEGKNAVDIEIRDR